MSELPDIKAKPGGCEEASPASHMFYIPCNKPAVRLLWSEGDQREYRMCEPCAQHNLRRRMTIIGTPDQQGKIRRD